MTGDNLGSPFLVAIADLTDRTRPPRRVCEHDGCETILSRYNPSTFCAAHEPEPEVLRYEGYSFRVCGCGEVYQVNKHGGSRLCPECKRAVLADERKRRAFRERTKPLCKYRRKDAIQRAQQKIAARLADRPTVRGITPSGEQRHEVSP